MTPKYTDHTTAVAALTVTAWAVPQIAPLIWHQVLPWESVLALLVWMASLVGATYIAVRKMPRSLITGVLTGDAIKQFLSELLDRFKIGTDDQEDDDEPTS